MTEEGVTGFITPICGVVTLLISARGLPRNMMIDVFYLWFIWYCLFYICTETPFFLRFWGEFLSCFIYFEVMKFIELHTWVVRGPPKTPWRSQSQILGLRYLNKPQSPPCQKHPNKNNTRGYKWRFLHNTKHKIAQLVQSSNRKNKFAKKHRSIWCLTKHL